MSPELDAMLLRLTFALLILAWFVIGLLLSGGVTFALHYVVTVWKARR